MRILRRESAWIAIDKEPGELVVPPRTGEREGTIQAALEAELGQEVYVVHRLDRGTSGLLLFALDRPTHRTLSMAFEAGRIHKSYLALVAGRVETTLDLSWPLAPARRGRTRIAKAGEGKPSSTLVRPIETLEEASWVEAQPRTGRTHQIRVHLREAGHPLLFDPQYGTESARALAAAIGLSRTPLHACSLRIPRLPGFSPTELIAEVPEDLLAALRQLRGRTPTEKPRMGVSSPASQLNRTR